MRKFLFVIFCVFALSYVYTNKNIVFGAADCSITPVAPNTCAQQSSTRLGLCGLNGGCSPGQLCANIPRLGVACVASASCEPCDDCKKNGAQICGPNGACTESGTCVQKVNPIKLVGESCIPGVSICCKVPGSVTLGEPPCITEGICYNNVCKSCLENGLPTSSVGDCCSGLAEISGAAVVLTCVAPKTGCANTGDLCGSDGGGLSCCKAHDYTAPELCLEGSDGYLNCTATEPQRGACESNVGASCPTDVAGYCCEEKGISCQPISGKPGEGLCLQKLYPASNTYNGPTLTIKELIALIYKIMVPVSVGFGLFFIILAGYTLKTSEGDPIKKKAGMEQLSAAIIGTLFVVLSLTILQIIIKSVLGGS